MSWRKRWVDRFYRSRAGWKDGTTEFHELCRAHAPYKAHILEIGAGPTNKTSAFLAELGELHGVDISGEVHGNMHLKTAGLIESGRYPHADGSFDLAVSNYVVEHVEDPNLHLSEIQRVLRPGGHYVFRTPNLFHYVAIVSRATSHRFHVSVANPLRNLPIDAHDPWPTIYAMNTPAAVRRYSRNAGLDLVHLSLVEKEPSYGMYARPFFLAFMAYERCVNAVPALARFRANLFVVLRKAA